ncbi:hypothetical protein AX774_g8176 [Zancudomyces culisetae]|uniref:Uncharacterized protein n=1 Tax=Zancudomyces culisetae TaxID=1213189 RepID=A0A1R1PC49_ZANCU|nr:hypothetical protein AX774_g8176 [Zancudomyces culisetae]|eukprot:OMH78442.1 hypothetical protein AX774_g8176 [Zancudomyces culisetae]
MKYNRLVLETNKYKALSRALQESLADKTAQSNDLKQQVDKREEEIQVYKYYKNDLELVRDKVKCLQRKLAAEKKRNLRVEGIQQQVDDSSNNNDNPSPFEVQSPSIHSDTASFSLSSTINPLGKLTKTIYGLNNNDNCNVSDQDPNKVLSANSNSNSNSINPFKLTSTNSPKALRNPARNSASITNNKLKRQLQLSFSPLSKKGKFFL